MNVAVGCKCLEAQSDLTRNGSSGHERDSERMGFRLSERQKAGTNGSGLSKITHVLVVVVGVSEVKKLGTVDDRFYGRP